MTVLLLAAVLVTQPAETRDVETMTRLLTSLRAADPAVCELAGRSLTNFGGWRGSDSDEPMPVPMPVPMPMPHAGRGAHLSGPTLGRMTSNAMDGRVLAVFRSALRDQNRCVRRIAARVVAREQPAWAAAEFAALATDAAAGYREVGMLGLGELEDPKSIGTVTTGLGDRDEVVRAMAAWALGALEMTEAIPALGRAVGDESMRVRRRATWALGSIEDVAALPHLERALRDQAPEVRRMSAWALGEIESATAVPILRAALRDADWETRRMAAWALGEIESASALPALEGAKQDRSPAVRRAVQWAIARIDDRR